MHAVQSPFNTADSRSYWILDHGVLLLKRGKGKGVRNVKIDSVLGHARVREDGGLP